MSEAALLELINFGTQSASAVIAAVNKFRESKNLPALTAQEQFNANEAGLAEIESKIGDQTNG